MIECNWSSWINVINCRCDRCFNVRGFVYFLRPFMQYCVFSIFEWFNTDVEQQYPTGGRVYLKIGVSCAKL